MLLPSACIPVYSDDDTIAAISTPPGEGGIGIVRLSGNQAVEIVQTVFQGTHPRNGQSLSAYRLHYGHIIEPDSQAILDEVLVSVMRAPHSYTREDVVEINCHGGALALRKVLDLVLAGGARLALPGEFTKRAFLNGRIDLAQAESVIDIIRAKTDAGLQLAVQQMQGKLSAHVHQISSELSHLLAAIEASIDFVEDDIEVISAQQIQEVLHQILAEIDRLLANADEGRIVRDGLCLAIVGKPNVGKSSLLNLFLEEERAIVTPIPGTTRDTIEDYLNLHGIPLRLIDTAGIRQTADHVESLGVAKSRKVLEQADLVLLLLDASSPWSSEDEEIFQALGQKSTFVLLNKIDLPLQLTLKEVQHRCRQVRHIFPISITTHQGIAELKQALIDYAISVPLERVEVANSRHKHALSRARQALLQAQQSVGTGMSPEFIALDLREALNQAGRITGETTTEDILKDIFSNFCIGK